MSATAFQRRRREAAQAKASEPEAITREDVKGMKKAELVEILEAHNADTNGKVDALKARLIDVMFVDL